MHFFLNSTLLLRNILLLLLLLLLLYHKRGKDTALEAEAQLYSNNISWKQCK